jgi:flavin reductase (DIM6/NTAB) family NADH-FMN oxidoreductase RutF
MMASDLFQAQFRATMSRFATRVTVVTTASGGVFVGATVNAFCPVSLTPPLVLISLEHASSTLAQIRQSGIYAINILTAQQQHLAQRFARKESDGHKSFADIALRDGVTGAPLFAEALVHIECRLAAEHPGGDHTLVVGEVLALEYGLAQSGEDAAAPLTCYRSTFGTLGHEAVVARTPLPAEDSLRAH